MLLQPRFSIGDKVFVIRTPYYDGHGTDWIYESATYGVVVNGPFVVTTPSAGWQGPEGLAYHIDLFDVCGDRHSSLWFHELELVKLCQI